MSTNENSKDLLSVLWAGADILRGKKGKKQNSMSPEYIDHIIELYTARKDVEKEAHIATYEEIKANDYNLNIPRYADTFEQEEQISLSDLASKFSDIFAKMDTVDTDLIAQMGELTATDDDTKNELADLRKYWRAYYE